MGRLEGRVAVITGAGAIGPGWGNGRATAILFAREGAKIFAIDKDMASLAETVAELERDGEEFDTCVCDVTNSASIKSMVDSCMARFGRIDILVNNVGGGGQVAGAVELPEEVWDLQIDLNLKSVFLTCKHVLPIMAAQRSGAITASREWTGRRVATAPGTCSTASPATCNTRAAR